MNMLMAMELARMLGKRNLQAFSLTPGPGASPTHLADHIDWTVEFEEMRKSADRMSDGMWLMFSSQGRSLSRELARVAEGFPTINA
jgi:hypothetical protein